jgi:hypothetical protein
MRSTLLGILANPGLSATKISAGMVGDSFALVADGLESGADVLSGLVVFFGLKIAIKHQIGITLTGTASQTNSRSVRGALASSCGCNDYGGKHP